MTRNLQRHRTACRGPRLRRPNEPWNSITRLLVALLLSARCNSVAEAHIGTECPTDLVFPCTCYNYEEGLFFECASANEAVLRSALLSVINTDADGQIQSLSVYELDKAIEELREYAFPEGSKIRHLKVSQSSLSEVSEDAFRNIRDSLESLGVVSGRLSQVPQKALAGLQKLAVLDLESNLIQELQSYEFYKLKLLKLILKGNQIAKISEYAFEGLERDLTFLDLSENKLRYFPMAPLRRLELLASLRLSWNEITELPDDGHSTIPSLTILDLSSNNFDKLGRDCFRPYPAIKTLSLYYNSIEEVDKQAFISLKLLESIDLSHNKIVFLDATTFRSNVHLRTIELSHNHIHYIGGVFAELPELYELYLAENNILEIPQDAFRGSISLRVLHIQQNAIRSVDGRGLVGLIQLEQLHLSNNYIEKIPIEFFDGTGNLTSLSLDNNQIQHLYPGTFSRLGKLHELRLQDNRIKRVNRGIFAPLPELEELHLQNNLVSEMESGSLSTLSHLEHVNLQGNQLTVLGDVFHLNFSSLKSIQLDSNALSELHKNSLSGQASVREMWLGHNKLTHLQAPLFRDLVHAERLYLANNSISQIDDATFQAMKALKVLELSMNRLNQITEKTFAGLHELEELYLQDNELRRLVPFALSALKRLRILDLSNNNLEVLEDRIFQDALPIRQLNLYNCSLMDIESGVFLGLTDLVELNLEDNRLTAPSLRRLQISGLRTLTASGNYFDKLSDQSLHGLPSLQELSLDNCGITEMPEGIFILNVNLVKIHLNHNRLRGLPHGVFDQLSSLRELRINNNSLNAVPYVALLNAKNLEILSLSDNEISNVDFSSLSILKSLREINFSSNRINTLSGFASANLTRLLSIDLSNNHLSTLPANFFLNSVILRGVNLAENRFTLIPSIALSGQNLPSLISLNLTKNPLSRINEQPVNVTYPMLQELYISGTNLTIVTSQDFEAFPALQYLDLSQNSISRISPGAFRITPNLLKLHLGMNSLENLPRERLQGLEHLRILNLTRNQLKELEEFPEDLKSLQTLDLSFNQIGVVGKETFKNLINLVELHLYGNWINAISGDAFRPLKKLRVLDLSRNYLENLPLNAFRPLETQIRSLRAEENPLNCGCESQELWEWLRDHQKVVGGGVVRNRGSGHGGGDVVGDGVEGLLKCDQPPELRGLVFLDLDPGKFCSQPLVLKLACQDIQPFSVVVSWQSRNHSGLHGYQLLYHLLDRVDEVRGKLLDPKTRSVHLQNLLPDTRYLICVVGLGSWSTPVPEEASRLAQWNSTGLPEDEVIESSAHPVMINTPMSRCTEVRTLDAVSSITSDGALGERGGLASILTRRLGLIVGSCAGVVVFVVLISVLTYFKVKKQKAAAKREQPLQPNPPDYMSYRHFSLQSGDRAEHSTCPSFINSVGPGALGT